MSLDFVNFLKEIGLCDAAQTAVLKSDAALDRDSLAPLCQPLFDPEADDARNYGAIAKNCYGYQNVAVYVCAVG